MQFGVDTGCNGAKIGIVRIALDQGSGLLHQGLGLLPSRRIVHNPDQGPELLQVVFPHFLATRFGQGIAQSVTQLREARVAWVSFQAVLDSFECPFNIAPGLQFARVAD